MQATTTPMVRAKTAILIAIAAALVLAVAAAAVLHPSQAHAASSAGLKAGSAQTLRTQAACSQKCYLIETANTPVYSNAGLTSPIGAVYASDEVIINSFSSNKAAAHVTYPITGGGGRYKSGWIRTSSILSATGGNAFNSKGRFTTYRRPGGASYGAVYAGDQVVVLGRSGNWTQIRYPVPGGYKFAWAATSTVTANTTGEKIAPVEQPTSGGVALLNYAKTQLGKKYTAYKDCGFHWRAWCADFVSYCSQKTGQLKAVPKNSSVAGIRTAIKNAGGREYSKALIQRGSYVPQAGDIVIFKSSGASHVGIVNYAKGNRIYYIDGNNTTYGNGNDSCVHASNCKYSYAKLTCVLHPNYR